MRPLPGSRLDWKVAPRREDPTITGCGPTPGVGPITALRLFWQRRAEPEGRASRSEYWWVHGWACAWVLSGGSVSAGIGLADWNAGTVAFVGFATGTVVLWILLIRRPLWALSTRRLHDTGRNRARAGALWPYLQRGDSQANRFGPSPSSR